jgi:lipopolysaccharide/colanic/teichoic acid biosynthesis glycosyltransferase
MLIILLMPLLFILSVLIFIKFGCPIFFIQIRPGLDANPFKIYKIRTMTNVKDLDGNLLPNEKRITKFGIFLRSTSMDELPELFNVLRGEMSFVGPRPLLVEYLPYFTPEQNKRHLVKPGITGWAQVNGRNALSWPEKLSLDVWYVENQSFFLDIKILLLTIKKVIVRDSINHDGDKFMPRFDEYVKSQSKQK